MKAPLTNKDISKLKAGDRVFIDGTVYVARDQAHARGLPFDPKGQIIFYAGPVINQKGEMTAIGPTTASRMDSFLEPMLKLGVKATIGKGPRDKKAKALCKKYKAVYLIATGGVAALLAQCVKKHEIIAYPELGPEAVLKLEVSKFPAIVAYDSKGKDLFVQ